MKKKNKLCFLCGLPGADTKDHIPPKGIFPFNSKAQLITVPAHLECNKKFHKDDELFRNLIIAASYETKEGRKAWEMKVIPSWVKNYGAKLILRNLFIPLSVLDLRRGINKIIPVLGMEVELMERQIERWTRGFYYYHYQKPLKSNAKIKVEKLQPTYFNFLKNLQINDKQSYLHEVIKNIFSYFLIINEDMRTTGFIVFIFYNTQIFSAAINISPIKR